MLQAIRRLMSWSSSAAVVAGLLVFGAPVVGSTTVKAATQESSTCVNTPQTGRVSGVITDKSTGSEVPYSSGARVRLVHLDFDVIIACVIADANGRYAIETDRTGNGYLISVDPAPGAASALGSTGSNIRLTTSPVVRNYSLGKASYQGVATLNGGYPTDVMVCLDNEVVRRRCGFVSPRSDSEPPRFAIYDGGLQGDVYSLVARKKSTDLELNGAVEIASLPDALNINIEMYEMQAEIDMSKSNGCEGGKSPNVTGRVAVGGSGYSTTVRLGQGWSAYSSTTAPNDAYLGLSTTSAADGSYQFCVGTSSEEGVPRVLRASASVANISLSPGLGETLSTWIDASCLLTS